MTSEINVLSRSQVIVVDPVSRSVAVINGGPQGPAGPAGPPGDIDTTLSEHLRLVCARDPELIIIGDITRDGDGLVPTADCVWPDGAPGTFTVEDYSDDFPGAVDSYSVTYEPVGEPTRWRTLTQPVMTRDLSGAVIERPDIVITGP